MRSSVALITALAAVAVMVAVLAGSTVAQSPSAPASVAPSTSPAALGSPAARVAAGPIEWSIVKKGKDFTTNPAVYSVGQLPDGRLMVVGNTAKDPSQPIGAAWVSANGSKWTRLKGLKAPNGSYVFAIANLGTTAVAVGAGGDGSGLAWSSGDGSTWTKAVPMSGLMYSLTATPTALVGVGIEAGAPTAWTTTDGLTWSPTALAQSGRALHVVAGPDGTLVAAGAVTDTDGVSTPVVWTSLDGTTWTQTILEGLSPGQWSIPAAASTPAGFVVTLSEQGTGHVWSSPDGIAWTETSVDQEGPMTAAGSVGTDALLIGHGQMLRSPDGVTWTPTKVKTFDAWVVRDVMTLADGRLFAAGDAFEGMGSTMATWTGTAEALP